MEDLKELEKNNIINLIKSKNFLEAEKKINLLLEIFAYSNFNYDSLASVLSKKWEYNGKIIVIFIYFF